LRTFAGATREANPEVQAAWGSWNNSERRLMAVISQRTLPLQGRVARAFETPAPAANVRIYVA
jgi:hypothetical protein